MSSKPLAPHGSYARANGRPSAGIPRCLCPPCLKTKAAYNSRRYVLTATGRPLTVDPAPATAHLRMLLDNGATWTTIGKAGISHQTISALIHGTCGYVLRATEKAILALKPEDVSSPHRRIPAVGTVRRIQALMCIGHPVEAIARSVGCSRSHVRALLAGELGDVAAGEAQRFAAAYGPMVRIPGNSARSRLRAQRSGWAGPMAWDTSTIDDPNASPETDEVEPNESKFSRAKERRDEVMHLARYGVPSEDIAQRLGMNATYVREQLTGRRAPGWRRQEAA